MAAKVASLLIDVAADVASIRKDFDQIGGSIEGFGKKVADIGKALVAAFAVREALAFGDRIQASADAMSDMAENLKLPVEDFQALQNAAYLAGQGIDATSTALAKFNVFIGKASEGSKEQIEALNNLGVKILDANGKLRSQQDTLRDVATAITSIEEPAKRAAAEVVVFGKSGQSVSAILQQWTKSTDDLNAELGRLGLVHSPEVTKQLAEMADKADIASKRFEVLFAIVYAPAKASALGWLADTMNRIAQSVIAIGGYTSTLDKLAELMNAFTGGRVVDPIARAISGDENVGPLQRLNATVVEIQNNLVEAKKAQRDLEETGKASTSVYADQVMKVTQLEAQLTRAQNAQRQLMGLQVTGTGGTGGGVSNPAIKGGSAGVDKFAEAMRRVKDETEATQKAIDYFNETAGKLPTKEAERYAKLQQDIGLAQSRLTKDLTPQQAEQIRPLIENLEKLKFQFEDLKVVQRTGDAVTAKYGDGQKELTDTIYYLDQARQKQIITEKEYAAALSDATDKAALQGEVNKGLGEGMEQIAAGFTYASLQFQQAHSSFQTGQQLFSSTFALMSDAISEFVETGSIDFTKLAASFAKMLANMALQLAAHQILSAILGIGSGKKTGIDAEIADWSSYGSKGGGSSWVGSLFSVVGSLFGGFKAAGGPVQPGYGYVVGEQGPERFVPSVPGNIVPNNDNASSGDVTVNVDMGTTQGARDPTKAIEFGRKLQSAVKDVINNERRPGGMLYGKAT